MSALTALDEEMADLSKRLAEARQSEVWEPMPSAKPVPPDTEAIDWKEVVADLTARRERGESWDSEKMSMLRQRTNNFDTDGILAALDLIDTLAPAESERQALEFMLVEKLIIRSPDRVMERFAERVGDEKDSLDTHFSLAFENWISKDPEAAVAWFDRKISEGNFDSKLLVGTSRTRAEFEALVIPSLVSENFAAAEKRLDGLSQNQKWQIFLRCQFQHPDAAKEAAFASLVRSQSEGEMGRKVLGIRADSAVTSGDFSSTEAYLDAISATPEERKSVADEAAEKEARKNRR